MKTGHRRFAYLSPDLSMSSLTDRYSGVVSALAAHGLMSQSEFLGLIPANEEIMPDWYASGKHAFIRRWLDYVLDRPVSERPDSIFCGNDFIAITVMNSLLEMGVKVPDDISIVGFDNIDYAQWLPTPLTTVAHDFARIGRLAGQRLLKRFLSESSAADSDSASDHCLVIPNLGFFDDI